MRATMPMAVATLLALMTARPLVGQITSNPIPAPIEKRGLAVQIRDLVRLPDSRGLRPPTRTWRPRAGRASASCAICPTAAASPTTHAAFCTCSTGTTSRASTPNVAAAFPMAVYNRLESGFIGFTFHPEFARNGLFYTVHAERGPGNPKKPDFIPPGYTPADVTYHNIITEWHATNPAANTFEGHAARAASRSAHRHQPHASDGRGRVQPDGEARRRGLRPALHERQRSRVQQRRRTATPTIPARRSASTRSSPRFCGSIRAVRR